MIENGFTLIVIIYLLLQAGRTIRLFNTISDAVERSTNFKQACAAFRRQIVKNKKSTRLTLDRLHLIEAADDLIIKVERTHKMGQWRIWALNMSISFYLIFELVAVFGSLLLIGRALGLADFEIDKQLLRELFVAALLVEVSIPRLIFFLGGKYDEFLSTHLVVFEMARQMKDDDLPPEIRAGLLAVARDRHRS